MWLSIFKKIQKSFHIFSVKHRNKKNRLPANFEKIVFDSLLLHILSLWKFSLNAYRTPMRLSYRGELWLRIPAPGWQTDSTNCLPPPSPLGGGGGRGGKHCCQFWIGSWCLSHPPTPVMGGRRRTIGLAGVRRLPPCLFSCFAPLFSS